MRDNYPALTSFRFFAFFAVFLFHAGLLPVGYLGVQAFFVLSGFLITDILASMKRNLSGKQYFLDFYGRRILRIFPVYYFYLLCVTLVALPWFLPEFRSGIPRVDRFYHQLPWALTYTYNVFHASIFFKHTHLLSHFWSLAIEEQFYLLWPLAIFLVPDRQRKIFLLLVIAAGPVLRAATGWLAVSGVCSVIGTDAGTVVYVSPFSHLDAFAAGGFGALYGASFTSSRTAMWSWCLPVLILVSGVASAWLASDGIVWLAAGFTDFMSHGYQYVWGYSLFNIWFMLVLVHLRIAPAPAFMAAPALVYLGSISYGLYVFHNAFIWLAGLWLPGQLLLATALALVLTFLAAAASYRLLEKPCLALKDRWFPSR